MIFIFIQLSTVMISLIKKIGGVPTGRAIRSKSSPGLPFRAFRAVGFPLLSLTQNIEVQLTNTSCFVKTQLI